MLQLARNQERSLRDMNAKLDLDQSRQAQLIDVTHSVALIKTAEQLQQIIGQYEEISQPLPEPFATKALRLLIDRIIEFADNPFRSPRAASTAERKLATISEELTTMLYTNRRSIPVPTVPRRGEEADDSDIDDIPF